MQLGQVADLVRRVEGLGLQSGHAGLLESGLVSKGKADGSLVPQSPGPSGT
jgi:hypothetical protein